MSPERLGQIEELYHLARRRTREERAQLLAQADPELRREVDSLLAQDGGEGVLDRPAMEVVAKLLEDSSAERLALGTSLGPYRIESSIGAGGMGQVYKARDTRLGRAVAIKISSHQFNARFEREARAISALNHPHICTLHDIGPDYLVMELVEGSTLAERLKQGALPIESVLRYGAQIADALAAAHAQGIIHRDLKPSNIIIAKSGVKVLDFGLAKSQHDETMTSSRVVMGSPAYMAPEQREGKACDARTDIYALGLILYEMATGKRPPQDQPTPVDNLPEGVAHVIQRCLELDAEQRWQSARDIKVQLEWLAVPKTPTPAPRSRSNSVWIAVAAIASLIAAVFAFAYLTRKAPDTQMARFTFAPRFKADAIDVAVSPDGRSIVFADMGGGTGLAGTGLWLRPTDSFTAQKLPDTEGAIGPFWSPDGHSLGFLSGGLLKRVDSSGEQRSVQTMSSAAQYSGGAWSPRGVILYTPEQTGTGLFRIPASGGAPAPATDLNPARHEISHRFPQFLPDGRHFIYWVWSASEENTGIYAGSLDSNERLPDGPLVRTWREARYVEPGYLLFLRSSRLVAQRFDSARLRLSGEPHPLPESVGVHGIFTGKAMFSAFSGGVLAYQEALPQPGRQIVWRDRAGNRLRSIEAPAGSSNLALDPDEKHVALYGDDENTLEDLWIVELERGTASRLTASHGSSMDPVWSPDGRRIAFRSNRTGVYDLYIQDANGAGGEEVVVKSLHEKDATGWSQDGHFLVYDELHPKTGYDIWVLPLEGDRKPFAFLRTEFNEQVGSLSPSPDGQGRLWMAYASDETGRKEIYLRPFQPGVPGGPAAPKVRVSTGGGFYPQWRKDSRELFYSAGDKLMAVDVKLGAPPVVGTPHELFEHPAVSNGSGGYTTFADGQRFLFIEPTGEPQAPRINVVLNWAAGLKRN